MNNQKLDFLKNTKFILIVFFVLGLFYRILFIHSIRLDYDEGLFLVIGLVNRNEGLLEGIITNFPNSYGIPLDHPPLVPLFYSLLYSFFPFSYITGRLANVILSSFSIILIYFIVREIWDYKTGLVAAFIVTIDPTLVMGIWMTMDALTNLVFCISCFITIKAIKSNDIKWHLIAGISFGVCMLTKWTLVFLPISYVAYYLYYSIMINKNNPLESIRNVIISASIAFSIFLPWFIWMGVSGVFPRIFFLAGYLTRLTNPLNNTFQTWRYSPFILFIAIFSFMYYFLNHKETRLPLLYSLLVIYPLFLLFPRYYDYATILYLFIILGAKSTTDLFDQAFSFFIKIRQSIFNLDNLQVDFHILLSTTIIILLVGVNNGIIVQEVIFEKDQTIQQTVQYIKGNWSENTTIISSPQFAALLIPHPWISNYHGKLGSNYILIYTPIDEYTPNIIEGVKKGFITENDTTYLFIRDTEINDVTIFQIALNQT